MELADWQQFFSKAKLCNSLLCDGREAARDDCQRYGGADLYNPEYEDEAEFLALHILNYGKWLKCNSYSFTH